MRRAFSLDNCQQNKYIGIKFTLHWQYLCLLLGSHFSEWPSLQIQDNSTADVSKQHILPTFLVTLAGYLATKKKKKKEIRHNPAQVKHFKNTVIRLYLSEYIWMLVVLQGAAHGSISFLDFTTTMKGVIGREEAPRELSEIQDRIWNQVPPCPGPTLHLLIRMNIMYCCLDAGKSKFTMWL